MVPEAERRVPDRFIIFLKLCIQTRKFPVEYDRSLFIYEWSRHWIKVVHLDENNNVSRIEPFMPNQKFVRPIDMAFGPEGALYVIEYGETWGVNSDARLLRIDYVRGNRTPVVVASVENNIGKEPLTVSVSSVGTFDKDAGDKLKYEWRLINTADQQAAPKLFRMNRRLTLPLMCRESIISNWLLRILTVRVEPPRCLLSLEMHARDSIY